MNRRFRSIYLSAIAVAGTGLIGSFFISAAQADVWTKQPLIVATKHFIAKHRVLQPAKTMPAPTQNQ